ncbi:MAG: hypothetical protein QNJ12_06100 [Ilumatobacter sp.]|uniref:hypothetical protein n=1 Tax=Ilumatobacter sp. TaxID=1967498 RepID=UPI0026048FA2|nr:hypothetical protein [Ilumatobacter sp.]MDJ0768344.1 hypothetical protein [Ilumatobacter sp.]
MDRSRSPDAEALIDELQRESELRRAELRAIAAAMPEAVSRRALVRSMAKSIATAPDKPRVVRRVVAKIVRTPLDMVRGRR